MPECKNIEEEKKTVLMYFIGPWEIFLNIMAVLKN